MRITSWSKPVVTALGAVTTVLALAAVALTLMTPAGRSIAGVQDIVRALTGIAFAAVGALIVWRRENLVGWLLAVVGLSYTASYEFATRYVTYSLTADQLPADDVMAWFRGWAWVPAFSILLVFLPLVFPNGKLPSGRWGILAAAAIVTSAVVMFIAIVSPDNPTYLTPQWRNPLGGGLQFGALSDRNQGLISTAYLLTVGLGAIAIASLVLRYRRSNSLVRRQLQWFGGGTAVVIIGWVTTSNLPQLVVGVIPVAVGIAVLRYQLYEIDLAISKALLYTALAAFITVIYLGVVVGLGSLIGAGGGFRIVLGIFATALTAVAFQPARDWMNRLANRIVFGLPSNPYDVLAEAGKPTPGVNLVEALERIANAIAAGARADRIRVRLLLPDERWCTATWPRRAAGPFGVAYRVENSGELIAEIETDNSASQISIPTFVAQASLALRGLRLSAEVAQRVNELETQAAELAASRRRLVEAEEAERRRLERDLHDGVQQELVALIAKARLARNQLQRDPDQAAATLIELQTGIQRALSDLRQVAHGIHPAVLGSHGLVEAVEAMAARMPIGIHVEADPALRETRYAAEVEGAAYFVIAEGLTNVMKHSLANEAWISIAGDDTQLIVQVDDDGRGFPPSAVRESGLRGLRDRLEALGGRLSISSSDSGTRLAASLPARQHVAV